MLMTGLVVAALVAGPGTAASLPQAGDGSSLVFVSFNDRGAIPIRWHHRNDDDDNGNNNIGYNNGNDTQTNNNNTTQSPIQACGNSVNSGVIAYNSRGISNNSSNNGSCNQSNSVVNNN
jgi:hypothetical protein